MFEFLSKLLDIGRQTPQAPAGPSPHAGTPVQKSSTPFPDQSPNLHFGTADHPFTQQNKTPVAPSYLNAQIPGNYYPSYGIYSSTQQPQPNGQWLENDNAPQGAPSQRSYLPTNQLPDQPYNPTQFTSSPNIAQPQYRQPQPPNFPSSRI